MRRPLITLLLIMCLLIPSIPAASQRTDWPTSTPEEHGIDSALLAESLVSIHEQVPAAHSLVIAQDGQLVLNAAFFPYDGMTPHNLASVTKSYMTTLIGIAIDQGKLSLDDTVLSFFPDRTIANVDPRKELLTIEDLVSNRTGMACHWQPSEPQLAEMEASDDYVQYALDLPMVGEPGTTWDYCSPGMHLLSAILTEATGMTALDFGWEFLFGPLGMRDVIWPADAQGYTHGWGNLTLYPQDAAKIGQLFLNGGTWNGQRIVSEEWISAATTPHVQTADPEQSYGYGWWIQNESEVGGEYKASGRAGQYVTVFPALDMVIGITGGQDFGAGAVHEPLIPALNLDTWGEPLPENAAGLEELEQTIATLTSPPAAQAVPPAPAIASDVSGVVYQLAANDVGLESFSVNLQQENEAILTLTYVDDAEGPLVVAIGLDGVYHLSPGDYGLPMASKGEWRDESTVVAELQLVGNLNSYILSARFDDDTVYFEITDLESGAVIPFEGTAINAGGTPASTP